MMPIFGVNKIIVKLINNIYIPKTDNNFTISFILYCIPIYPAAMIVQRKISQRDKEISQYTDQEMETPQYITKGRSTQLDLTFSRNSEPKLCFNKIQRQNNVNINHATNSRYTIPGTIHTT